MSWGGKPTATWQNISYATNWSDFDATNYQRGQYKKVVTDGGIRVELRGMVKCSSATVPSTITTLPTGFAPQKICVLDTNAGDASACRIHITPAGVVQVQNGTVTSWVTLDGLSFWLD